MPRPSTARRLVAAALGSLATLALAGCSSGTGGASPLATSPSPGAPASASSEAATRSEVAAVTAAFATYRAGVVQGDGAAVVDVLDQASLADMARVADLARTADGPAVRGLPAAEQLLVLTYRLRPELLEAPDPYAALVDAGLGGQDRSLGELGEVQLLGGDRALGVVVDATSGQPTPLRWRFAREDGTWRFDLLDAHRALSTAIAASAGRSGVGVDDLVAATVSDLSGEDRDTVQALYATPGG